MKKVLFLGLCTFGILLSACKNKTDDEDVKVKETTYTKEETIEKVKEAVENVNNSDCTLDIDGNIKLKMNLPTNANESTGEYSEAIAVLNDITVFIDGYSSIDFETKNSYEELKTIISVAGATSMSQTITSHIINEGDFAYSYNTIISDKTEKSLVIEYIDKEEGQNNDINFDDASITGKGVGDVVTVRFNIEDNKQLFEKLGGNNIIGEYAPNVDLSKEEYKGDVVLTIKDHTIDKLELRNFETTTSIDEGISTTIKANIIVKYNKGLRTVPMIPTDKDSYTLTRTPIDGSYSYILNGEAFEISFDVDEFLITNSSNVVKYSGKVTTADYYTFNLQYNGSDVLPMTSITCNYKDGVYKSDTDIILNKK